MATISKILLSPSGTQLTDATSIAVSLSDTDTDAAYAEIHEGPALPADYDEVWLWCSNFGVSAHTLCLYFGGLDNEDDPFSDEKNTLSMHTIQPQETVLVCPGWILRGRASQQQRISALVDQINSDANNVVALNVFGYVNRIDDA
jgi:hypothetical protein